MPAVRPITRRRRSSLAVGLTQIKPGNYGINTPSPRNVTFAPNVTPGTFVEPDASDNDADSEPPSPSTALFPPAETPAPAPSRRRQPPGKRRSQGYIPRPPNAFMLFRADFVRQKHVPGSIETNHGSLSKIIGTCWRQLPLEEKRVWESKAKKAKAEHREKYPNYRFRPVHNKHKKEQAAAEAAKRNKVPVPAQDERRCEEVAQLLLEGMKGDELAAAVRKLDLERTREYGIPSSTCPSMAPSPMLHMPIPLPLSMAAPIPLYAQRRSSSVPPPTTLYNHISIPTVPFFAPQPHHAHVASSRPESPVSSIARHQRAIWGQRRASSACPTFPIHWGMNQDHNISFGQLQPDDEPLPEVDTSLFEPSFLDSFSSAQSNANGLYVDTYGQTSQHSDLDLNISPLDSVGSSSTATPASAFPYYQQGPMDPSSHNAHGMAVPSWMQTPGLENTASGPSSAFSGSPAPSEASLPVNAMSGYDWNTIQVQGDEAMAMHMEQYIDPSAMYVDSNSLQVVDHHTPMYIGTDCADGSPYPMSYTPDGYSNGVGEIRYESVV
ncbi:SOX/SOX-like transcription factor [Abortiporus biennis]